MSSKQASPRCQIHWLLLLISLAYLANGQPASAFKLPSFLAWIQPHQGGTSYIATSSGPISLGQAPSHKQLPHPVQASHEEPMLASATSTVSHAGAASGQQPAGRLNSLKKPFQSMLMLPSKHNQIHLFSNLPRSLFGRLFNAKDSQQSPKLGPSQQMSAKWPHNVRMAATNFKPLYPLPGGIHIDEQQLVRQALAANANRQAHPIGWPQLAIMEGGKHALGLGSNDEFMIFEQLRPIAASGSFQQAVHELNSPPTSSSASSASPADYRELPAIVISETLPASNPQPANESDFGEQLDSGRFNGTLASSGDRNETRETSTIGSEPTMAAKQLAVAKQDDEGTTSGSQLTADTTSSPQITTSEPSTTTALPSTTLSSLNETDPTQASGDQVATSDSGLPDSRDLPSGGTLEDESQSRLAANTSELDDGNRNHGPILTSLIGSELLRLNREPATLNRTVDSMGQQLASLMMHDSPARGGRQEQQEHLQAMHQLISTDGDELGSAASQAALQAANEDQPESFILGPYRPNSGDHRAELHPVSLERPMASKSSSILEQARNFIQLPFTGNSIRSPFRPSQAEQMTIQPSSNSLDWLSLRQPVGNAYRQAGTPFHAATRLVAQHSAPSNLQWGFQQQQLHPKLHRQPNGPILAQHLQSGHYFPMKSTNGQPNRPNVPYLVDPSALQSMQRTRPLNRDQQQAHLSPQQTNFGHHFQVHQQQQRLATGLTADKFYLPDQNGRPVRLPTRQGHLADGYQLVINHSQRQADSPAYAQMTPVELAEAAKFKSGLYQMEPPKLQPSQQVESVQQQQVEVGDSEQPDGVQQQQEEAKDDEPASDNDPSDDAGTEQPSEGLLKQVGASMGVAGQQKAANATKKGQVFNEPVASGERSTSSQMKTLRLSKDVTLYDFELPEGEQTAGAARHPSWVEHTSQELPSRPASGSGYLDTQVYTIPYTLTMQASDHLTGAPNSSSLRPQSPAHQSAQPAFPHIGRFPLPYLAPPAPQRERLESAQIYQQSAQLPSINALAIQTVPEETHKYKSPQQQVDNVSFGEPLSLRPASSLSDGPTKEEEPREQYFHYQPIGLTSQPHVAPVQPLTSIDSVGNYQQQYAMTIQHDGPSKAGLALFSTSPAQARNTESANLSTSVQVPQRQEQRESPTIRDDDDADDDEIPAAVPSLEQVPAGSSGEPSNPSVFCANRAAGLYADESQRCRAYYQCAPTGHQMFKCNNQTQFNQKTQNCDWWYNVDCGGRSGNPSDFEQTSALGGDSSSTSAGSVGSSPAPLVQVATNLPGINTQSTIAIAADDAPKEQQATKSWTPRLQPTQQLQGDAEQQSDQVMMDSRFNSTLSPDQAQARQQVVEPTSATPIYQQPDGLTQRTTSLIDIPRASTGSAELAASGEPMLSESSTPASSLAPGEDQVTSTQSGDPGAEEQSSRPQVGDEPEEETSTSGARIGNLPEPQTTTSNQISSSPLSSTQFATPNSALEQVTQPDAQGESSSRLSEPVASTNSEAGNRMARSQEPESVAPGLRFESSRQKSGLGASGNQHGKAPFSNHRYFPIASSELEEQQQQIYSTSANQGSVTYTPAADQSYLSAQGLSPGSTSPSSTTTTTTASMSTVSPSTGAPANGAQRGSPLGIERRFGARLLGLKASTPANLTAR